MAMEKEARNHGESALVYNLRNGYQKDQLLVGDLPSSNFVSSEHFQSTLLESTLPYLYLTFGGRIRLT